MLGAGVFIQPKAGEVRQAAKMPNLVQVPYLILAYVQLAEAPATHKVAERAYLVYTETLSK